MKHSCAFCPYQSDDIVAIGNHYDANHKSMLPVGIRGEQFAYYIKTGRKHGSCVVCHKPTAWNEKTHKYHRICSEKCKREYGQIKKLNDPKVQEEMLAHRKISGEYIWSTPSPNGNRPTFRYTGSYELDFLIYLDKVKHWSTNDLIMPCPILFQYRYDGQQRYYIPDAYIPSLDLVIEIKDGNPMNPEHHANQNPEIQRVNRVKEKLKKEAVLKTQHQYMIIYNKDYRGFEQYLRTNKTQYLSEGILDTTGKVLNSMSEYMLDIDPRDQIAKLVKEWKEFVKEYALEKYCKESTRRNETMLSILDSKAYEEAILLRKTKELMTDTILIELNAAEVHFSFMDSDNDLKVEFTDPYFIYTQEYTDAKAKLMKWKKPRKLVYLGPEIDVDYEEADTHQLVLTYDLIPDDDDQKD